jgi:hypothetical protein
MGYTNWGLDWRRAWLRVRRPVWFSGWGKVAEPLNLENGKGKIQSGK